MRGPKIVHERSGIRPMPPSAASARSRDRSPVAYAAWPAAAATDVVVVGGGVIGLAVAWRPAGAGLAVTVVDPEPGHGATWAAAGMLAPVAEAHFGEEALAALNVAAAGRGRAFARRARGRLRAARRLPGRRHPAGGGRCLGPGRHRRGARLPAGARARRQPAVGAGECRAARALLAPGIRGGVDAARRPPGRQPPAGRPPCSAPADAGVDVRRRRGRRGRSCAGGRVTGRAHCGTGARPAGRARGGGRRMPLRQLGGLPGGRPPPVRPVKGLTLRLRRRDGVPRCAARCGAWSTDGPATWCPGTTARWWSGPPSRSGLRPHRRRSGGRRPARRRPPAGARARRVRAGRDGHRACVPARPTTRPLVGRHRRRPGWWWPPATTATASCWPR